MAERFPSWENGNVGKTNGYTVHVAQKSRCFFYLKMSFGAGIMKERFRENLFLVAVSVENSNKELLWKSLA